MYRDFFSMLSRFVSGLVLLTALLPAQEFRATVSGRVVDASGAVMTDVTVQITNLGTNVVVSNQTSSQGIYRLPFLPPGTYRLTAEAPGFKRYIRENIVLNIGDAVGIDITMEIGDASQSVTVAAETPILNTESASRGLVIDQMRVTELPLSARNPIMLSLLAPGVNYNGPVNFLRPFDNGGLASWSMNGGQNGKNEFLLDGAPNNAQAGNNNIALVPPVDSVEEFKIQTNSYDAGFGKTSGGIVNVTLKGGTNRFSGTVYEFLRRSALDANSFPNNAAGIAKSGHFLDQYGGSVGGPILLPGYNGRDRSFFFANYEGYREGSPTPLTLSVPAPEFLEGDFSRLVDAQNRPITIYDPFGRVINPNGTVTRSPFPNNRIPSSLIDPITRNILGYFPRPSRDAAPGSAYGIGNLFIPGGKGEGQNLDQDDFYNLVLKFDQNWRNNHFFFRHASNDRSEFRNTNGVRGPGWTGPDPQKRINDAYVFDWVGTMTPTLIANARVSWSRYKEAGTGVDIRNFPFDATELGFPSAVVAQMPRQHFGAYSFTGYNNIGQNGGNFNATNTWALAASISKISGAHNVRFGADLRRVYFNQVNVGTGLNFTFNPAWTQRQFNQSDALSGNSWASGLLGLPQSGNTTIAASPAWLVPYYAFYFQDDWKITRKLTFNFGLRWDFHPGAFERYDRLTRGFDTDTTNPIDSLIDRTRVPGFPTVRGGLLHAASGQSPYNGDSSGIQPRFGAAYEVTSKLAVRAGWGRYVMNPANDWLRNDGFSRTTAIITSLDDGRTPIDGLLRNPYPQGLLQPPGTSLGLRTLLGENVSFFDPDFVLPHVNHFSAGFQYEMPWRTQLDVSYVGNRSYKLQSTAAYNLPDLDFRRQCNLLEGGSPVFCDQLSPNPFFGIPDLAGVSLGRSPNLSRNDLARPFPHFTGLTQMGRNDGKIWYNSMQVTYGIRSRPLNLTFAYTFSKMIQQSGLRDVVAGVMERSVSAQDRPHQLRVSSVYQLPFGRGQRFLGGAGRFLNAFVGGWEQNTIMHYQSGIPWTMPTDGRYVRDAKITPEWNSQVVTGVNRCVAQMNDNGSITLMPYSQGVAGCSLDTYNFLRLPRYAPGEGPLRDAIIRAQSKPTFDVSLNKTISFSERMRFQFRAEAFNITNTYLHRGLFNSTLTSSSFGQVTPSTVGQTQRVPPREIQLGMKFIF